MYRDHFKLKERPFIHAPGQRFFAPNPGVGEMIARLQHLLGARDTIAVVSGGPGVGKTTLVECALAATPDRVVAARVDARYTDAEDLYCGLLLALGESAENLRPVRALHELRQAMARMVRDDRRLVLCLDIGGITPDIARYLLRIANLGGEQGCQMNIILMGPHALHQQLDVPALIQLRQRITLRYRVRPLTLAETDRYIRHQIEVVGADPSTLISSNASAAVYCYVAGVPRLINTLMDATLSDACLQKLQRPDGNQVKRTADSLGWKPMAPPQAGTEASKQINATNGNGRDATPERIKSPAPKVAVVKSPKADDRQQKRIDAPPLSEMTLQLRSNGNGEVTVDKPGRAAAVNLASEAGSPTAALFGAAEGQPAQATAPGPIPAVNPALAMDPVDTSATGMLRLQDLDDRFAETIFGKQTEEAAKKRD